VPLQRGIAYRNLSCIGNVDMMVTIETIEPSPVNQHVKERPILTTRSTAASSSRMADQLHLDRFVPYRLAVLTNIVSMSIATACEQEFGLTIPEWRVLAVLARYPNLSAIEVSERAALDKVAVSRAVRSLMTAKRIVRGHDKGDRRRSILRLSPTGKSVYTRVAPVALRYERELLNALSTHDRRALNRLIGRLIERARELDGDAHRLEVTT
jgi:DNA-binding MarR family transcriptional regulator